MVNQAKIDRMIADTVEAEERSARLRALFDQRAAAKRPPQRKRPPFKVAKPSGPLTQTPDDAGEGDDGFDYQYAANGDYHAVCENLTGRPIPEQVFLDSQKRREQIDGQTLTIARALDSTGRFERRFDLGQRSAGSCTVIGAFSGTVLPLPSVRRTTLMPSVAKQQRAKMLRDVEHFLGCYMGRARMYTLTNGPRVTIDVELRGNVKAFHRRVSKLAHKLRDRFGVSIEWRATEFGTPETDPETGQMTLHLHAHLLVIEPESMHPKRRAKIRRKIWKLTTDRKSGAKRMWDDAGPIQEAREFVKYPVKGDDLEAIIRDRGPGVLADFFEQIRGLRLVESLGELRAVRSYRKAKARRITAFSRDDGRSLEDTGDWNAGKRPLTLPNKAKEAARKRVFWATLHNIVTMRNRLPLWGTSDENRLRDTAEAETEYYQEGNRRNGFDNTLRAPRVANRIIARLAPAPYGMPVCEPGFVVWGFDGNLAAVLNQPKALRVIEAHRAAWNNAMEARELIRACADTTARAQRASSEGSQRSTNCPAGFGELDLAGPADPPETPVLARRGPPGPLVWDELTAFSP